jgi:dihydrofolate synthase/folylpolyglutamate synthase
MDYIVLEAGLGGEFDATNVVENNLTLFTTIGLDHQNFLGDTISKIASTKMRSCDNSFILGYQKYDDVNLVKDEILKDKKEIFYSSFPISTKSKQLPDYLQKNLNLALSGLKELGYEMIEYKLPKLFGRFQQIDTNVTIDVGHNPLAAEAIVEQLKKEKRSINLVYNSFKDKDYKKVLTIFKPILKTVEIIDCDDERMVDKEILEKTITSLAIKVKKFDIMELDNKNYYLVFGSFIVVENFLKGYRKYEKR